MKTEDLQQDAIIQDWFLNINPKRNTRRSYLMAMQFFTEFTGKTPSELLKEAEAEVKNGVLMRDRSVRRYLSGFREYLEEVLVSQRC